MTGIFDALASLFYDSTREQKLPQEVAMMIFEEAIKELSKVDPVIITWDKWLNSGDVYARLYREKKSPLIETQANFINHCHNVLDHNGGYHSRCFSFDFLHLMDFVKEVKRYGFEKAEKWFIPIGISQKKWKQLKVKYKK